MYLGAKPSLGAPVIYPIIYICFHEFSNIIQSGEQVHEKIVKIITAVHATSEGRDRRKKIRLPGRLNFSVEGISQLQF